MPSQGTRKINCDYFENKIVEGKNWRSTICKLKKMNNIGKVEIDVRWLSKMEMTSSDFSWDPWVGSGRRWMDEKPWALWSPVLTRAPARAITFYLADFWSYRVRLHLTIALNCLDKYLKVTGSHHRRTLPQKIDKSVIHPAFMAAFWCVF